MKPKNWIVFYNRDTDTVIAREDKHNGYVLQKPDHLKLLGFPSAESEADAVKYICDILTEEDIKA